jgi:tetratricopeptide (TPR) repeat protein
MLNVQELERQWLRYKIKSYLPKAIISVIFISLSIFIIFYTLDSKDSTENISKIKEINSIDLSKKEEVTLEDSTPEIEIPVQKTHLLKTKKKQRKKESQLTLKPSLSFIDALKDIPKEDIVLAKPTPKPIKRKKTEHITQPKVEKEIELTQQVETAIKATDTEASKMQEEQVVESKMIINFQQEETDIKDVIKRFKNNKNPALSLFIAKRFYAIERYQDAYNYALLTNEINPEIEDSWLIAAKSLSHMNKKQKAIDLLDDFISKYHSIRAKMISQQIQDGTL